MSKITNNSLKNKIINYIYEAILNNTYRPKEQIKEALLAQKFDISRAPIREAFLELTALGILEQIPRRGVFVKDVTNKDIYNTYEAKGVIEGFLAKSFVNNANDKDFKYLETLVLKMSQNNNSEEMVAKIGSRFHKYYLKYSNNNILLENLEKLNKRSLLLFSNNWSKLYTIKEVKKRHQDIVDVIKTKNKIEIEKIIKEHYFQTGLKITQIKRHK